jgi:hypothetical protein
VGGEERVAKGAALQSVMTMFEVFRRVLNSFAETTLMVGDMMARFLEGLKLFALR